MKHDDNDDDDGDEDGDNDDDDDDGDEEAAAENDGYDGRDDNDVRTAILDSLKPYTTLTNGFRYWIV